MGEIAKFSGMADGWGIFQGGTNDKTLFVELNRCAEKTLLPIKRFAKIKIISQITPRVMLKEANSNFFGILE